MRNYDFRLLTKDDLTLLRRWFSAAHVQVWWPDVDAQIATILEDMQNPNVAPPLRDHILLMNPDAEAYNAQWREWWAYSIDGIAYPARRVAASVDYLLSRYPQIDLDQGYILKGGSMGGGGAVFLSMLLPEVHRSRVAYVTLSIGGPLPRVEPHKYSNSWPADAGVDSALWDAIDFEIQAVSDPVARGIHYRHRFSTNDANFDVFCMAISQCSTRHQSSGRSGHHKFFHFLSPSKQKLLFALFV